MSSLSSSPDSPNDDSSNIGEIDNSGQNSTSTSTTANSLPDIVNSNSSSPPSSASSTNTTVQRQPSSSQKQCWVCFATEEDDPDPDWVRPCRCRGSTMWVHQKCLQRWVDEKQRGNTFAAVACVSCGFTYTIIYPRANLAVLILEKVDRLIAKICPLMTGGIIIISLYWTAVTYGAITVMQMMGSERGMQTLEKADPIVLLCGLPTIPIVLITFKMIRWEDRIVAWLRDRYITRTNGERRHLAVPAEGLPINGAAAGGNDQAGIAQQQIIRDAASATRILCGALALPTIAVSVGKLIFGDSIEAPLKRACYGGAVFLVVRGATKIYFKYQQMLRQKNRKIVDFNPLLLRPLETAAANENIGANGPVNVQP